MDCPTRTELEFIHLRNQVNDILRPPSENLECAICSVSVNYPNEARPRHEIERKLDEFQSRVVASGYSYGILPTLDSLNEASEMEKSDVFRLPTLNEQLVRFVPRWQLRYLRQAPAINRGRPTGFRQYDVLVYSPTLYFITDDNAHCIKHDYYDHNCLLCATVARTFTPSAPIAYSHINCYFGQLQRVDEKGAIQHAHQREVCVRTRPFYEIEPKSMVTRFNVFAYYLFDPLGLRQISKLFPQRLEGPAARSVFWTTGGAGQPASTLRLLYLYKSQSNELLGEFVYTFGFQTRDLERDQTLENALENDVVSIMYDTCDDYKAKPEHKDQQNVPCYVLLGRGGNTEIRDMLRRALVDYLRGQVSARLREEGVRARQFTKIQRPILSVDEEKTVRERRAAELPIPPQLQESEITRLAKLYLLNLATFIAIFSELRETIDREREAKMPELKQARDQERLNEYLDDKLGRLYQYRLDQYFTNNPVVLQEQSGTYNHYKQEVTDKLHYISFDPL